MQPEPEVAIIDEADSVLIDEARVPLVLAGSAGAGDDLAAAAALVAGCSPRRTMRPTATAVRSASPTTASRGSSDCRRRHHDLCTDGELLTRVNVALYARALVRRDVDYLVVDGAVQLIDPDRGRVAQLRRWPDGLQAAVEAKEGLRRANAASC